MDNVSLLLQFAFVVVTLLTVLLFYRASHQSKRFLLLVAVWMLMQMLIGRTDFYTDTSTLPPRFALLIIPPVLLILGLFLSVQGRQFIDMLSLERLTLLHTIRIPVEIILYYLYIAKAIPEIMTFAGRNFDILAGLSAPLVYYFALRKAPIAKRALLVWNVVCILLLANIVGLAILSVPTAFQQFGLEQPNVAIAHFPFNWLPSVVVPLVFFAHFAALRRLLLGVEG